MQAKTRQGEERGNRSCETRTIQPLCHGMQLLRRSCGAAHVRCNCRVSRCLQQCGVEPLPWQAGRGGGKEEEEEAWWWRVEGGGKVIS